MSSAQSPHNVSVSLPPWVPRGPPGEWTLEEVQNHVKAGMIIELSTIPIYLYATWSIKNEGAGVDARSKIRGVFLQEMLHLSLAGNLLSALGGSVKLYDFDFVPRYPQNILYDEVEMTLDRASQESLERFTLIESPYRGNQSHVNDPDVESADTKKYHSIGEFYKELEAALALLPETDFTNNPDLQFTDKDFDGFDGELTVINSKALAEAKLDLIVQQGEGSGDPLFHTDSHYITFRDLIGKAGTWELYNVRQDPKTTYYQDLGSPQDYAYKLSLTFDASYCYLLQNIERVWATGGAENHTLLINNISNLMFGVLPPLSDILIRQQLTVDPTIPDIDLAAPCFNYFPLGDDGKPLDPLEPNDLHTAALDLVNQAIAIAPDGDKPSLQGIADQIKQSTPE